MKTETYTYEGFTLKMTETNQCARTGQKLVSYKLTSPDGKVIFKGNDFGASPIHESTIGKESACDLISMLTYMEDGKTLYFTEDTKNQKEFEKFLVDNDGFGYLWCENILPNYE